MKRKFLRLFVCFVFMLLANTGFCDRDISTVEGVKKTIKFAAKQFDGCSEKLIMSQILVLSCGEEKGTLEVINYLIKAGANIEQMGRWGRTPLMAAVDAGKPLEVVNALIKAGAHVNAKDKEGKTPLVFAVRESVKDTNNTFVYIETLLKAGANINVKENDGQTPLMEAIRCVKPLEVVKILLRAGAYIHATDNEGKTPLMFAAKLSTSKYLETLLKAGAKVNAKDNKGRTPLIYAATGCYYAKYRKSKSILKKYGARENIKDDYGRTAARIHREQKKKAKENEKNMVAW